MGVSDPHEADEFGGKKRRHVILLVKKLVLQSHGLAEIVVQGGGIGGLREDRRTTNRSLLPEKRSSSRIAGPRSATHDERTMTQGIQ